ncbi:MAG: DUF2924 domain-containing protein [Terriglobales bacterium]
MGRPRIDGVICFDPGGRDRIRRRSSPAAGPSCDIRHPRSHTGSDGRAIGRKRQQRLLDLSRAFEKGKDPAVARAPRMRPGTRLVRQWGDRVHLVSVESNGYEYQGARYRSLSEIARLITGTRWSGPLFFGIQKEKIQ